MKHRLFTAIDLPPELRSSIGSVQSRLDKAGIPVRSEEAEKLHLTLNFLGRIESDLVPSINQILTRTASEFQSFQLTPSYIDSMYKKHESSFVYLGLGGDVEELKKMRKSLALSLSQHLIPQSEKYLPHILIARYKKADPVFIKSAMDKITDFEFDPLPEFTVDRITLFESLLSQKGSHFRQIGQFLLK